MRAGIVGLLTAVAVASAWTAAGQPPRSIDPPAPPGAAFPTLASEDATTVNKGHDVLMTWLEPWKTGGRLRFARYGAGSWTPPITIAEGVAFPDPSDAPSLTVIDTQAVRRTLIARTANVVARSGDAGRTWTRLPSSVLPYASFAGGDEGAYAFWLETDAQGATQLLGSRVLAGRALLDDQVASGANTSAVMTWDGPVVVYRDRLAAGARGLAIVRRQEARWTPPRLILGEAGGAPPESAPRVIAHRRRIAVAWHTAGDDRPRLLVAFSSDAGRSFATPVHVDDVRDGHAPLPHLDIAMDDAGHALVLWTATSGASETLSLARVSADGDRGRPLLLAKRPSGILGGLPRIVRAGPNVAVAWTEGKPARVRARSVPLAGIPGLGSGPEAVVEVPEAVSRRGREGDTVPEIALVALDGRAVSSKGPGEGALLVNFWATWCLPCIGEIPELNALQETHRGDGLVVVGVNVDGANARAKVDAFVAENEMAFDVWLDPEAQLNNALRVRSLPTTFVVDREGRILLRRDGTITADDPELVKALGRALGGS